MTVTAKDILDGYNDEARAQVAALDTDEQVENTGSPLRSFLSEVAVAVCMDTARDPAEFVAPLARFFDSLASPATMVLIRTLIETAKSEAGYGLEPGTPNHQLWQVNVALAKEPAFIEALVRLRAWKAAGGAVRLGQKHAQTE